MGCAILAGRPGARKSTAKKRRRGLLPAVLFTNAYVVNQLLMKSFMLTPVP